MKTIVDSGSWEREETLQRMMEHGIDRVRGWEFTQYTLSSDDLNTIKTLLLGDHDLCRKCGFRGHYQGQCNTDPRRRAAWLREIERLQEEQEDSEDDLEDDDAGRRCACGADISDRPPHYTKCGGCHYGGAFRKSGL